MLTFTTYQNRFTDFTQNSATSNQTRGMQLVNDSLRYLTQKYYFNEQQYQTLTEAQVQTYTLPFDAKDIINETVTVGGILWQPIESGSRQMWDALNTIPFYNDFAQFFYRFKANQIQIFPIPTSSGDPIQINYKRRIKDLSQADYTTGTLSVNQWKAGSLLFTANSADIKCTTLSYTPILAVNDTLVIKAGSNLTLPSEFSTGTTYHVVSVGTASDSQTNAGNLDYTVQLSASQGGTAITPTKTVGVAAGQGGPLISYSRAGNVVTGSGTSWTNNMAGRWLNIPETASNTTSGDNRWYQIASVQSSTQVTLFNDYQGGDVTGGSYTIGEVPILPEDYQDLALYRAMWIYYTSIVPEPSQAKGFQELYEQGKAILDYEFGSKTTNPVLTPPNVPTWNPNLLPRLTSS